jgi:hypothetical protein
MHTAQQATGFRTSPTGLARYADLARQVRAAPLRLQQVFRNMYTSVTLSICMAMLCTDRCVRIATIVVIGLRCQKLASELISFERYS